MKMKLSMIPIIKKVTPVLLLSVFLLPLSARSEIKAGSVELSPFVGYNFFEKVQNLDNMPVYGGRLGYNITNNFGIEAVGEFIKSNVDDTSKTFSKEGQFTSPVDGVNITMYHLDLLYHFMPEGRFNPFVAAGYGAAHYSPRINNKNMSVINFGAGAKYWVAENIALRVDIRDNMVVDETINNIEATLGIVFRFGGDKKVVAATPAAKPAATPVVVAPVVAETRVVADTLAPTVKFTDPVNGNMAVPVNQKINIAFSEDMKPATITAASFSLKQGTTPVSGKVSSIASTATFTPANNLEKGKPYTATVTTGARDLAGNPLAKDYVWNFSAFSSPKVIAVLVKLQNSHFAYNSAEISEDGKTILNSNVKVLKNDPKMKLLVSGYTSAAGSIEYNQKLSEKRADAVKEYLVKNGIDGNRITTIGYGEANPARYEADPSDKLSASALANMRVIVEVVE